MENGGTYIQCLMKAANNLFQIKFFVARKTFREAVKPFDIKDVIEQYNVGHLDLCNRVKHLHARYIASKPETNDLDYLF